MPANHPAVLRVKQALRDAHHHDEVIALDVAARTAKEAAEHLSIDVGQVASSIVFGVAHDDAMVPLLVITSGRHRVDTERVAVLLGVEKLHRVDADFVRQWSGFAIGGVSPLGWTTRPHHILIDQVLSEYDEVWAAAGHPHTMFPTSFAELVRMTGATPAIVGD